MALVRDSSVFCIPNSTFPKERNIVAGVCIATSIIGFIGASLQLISLWKYRNSRRRTPSPNHRIILYLALSDLFACLGVCGLSAMVFLLPSENVTRLHIVYFTWVTEIITIFSFLASCIWTFAYALDMCFQIYKIECPMLVYKILCWLIPLNIVFWAEFANIRDDHYHHQICEHNSGSQTRLILSCIIVLITMFGNPFLFVITYNRIKRLLKLSGRFTDDQRKLLSKFKKKFFWIVFVFFLCWLPNVILLPYRFSCLFMRKDCHHDYTSLVLLGMEAFLNPLQGFFNYIVYRNAFQVATSETRTPRLPHSLSSHHVPIPYTVWTDSNGDREKADESITGDTSMTHDEETPHFRSYSSTEVKRPFDSYSCKLFGE